MPNKLLYEPRVMLKALRQNPAARRFLQKTFFARIERHATRFVEMDIQKTKRHIAAFTHPSLKAKIVERPGFNTVSIEPGYIKESKILRFPDLQSRGMGETVYDDITPEQRAAQIIGEDQRDLDDRFNRREELMCAQALVDGVVPVKGEGFDFDVDFGYVAGDHKQIISGTGAWNTATGNPVRDLRRLKREILKRCGIRPDRVIVGSDVADAIMENPIVAKLLDNRRVEVGNIAPAELAEGVDYVCTLARLPIYSYDEWYLDTDGTEKALIPADAVILGSTHARCAMHYGPIQNLKCRVRTERFPSSWEEEDGSARYLQLESAPIPCLAQPDAFAVVRVLN